MLWAADPRFGERMPTFQSATAVLNHTTQSTSDENGNEHRPRGFASATAVATGHEIRHPLGVQAAAAAAQALTAQQCQLLAVSTSRKHWPCRVCGLQLSSTSNRKRHERAKHPSSEAAQLDGRFLNPYLDDTSSTSESSAAADVGQRCDSPSKKIRDKQLKRKIEVVDDAELPQNSPSTSNKRAAWLPSSTSAPDAYGQTDEETKYEHKYDSTESVDVDYSSSSTRGSSSLGAEESSSSSDSSGSGTCSSSESGSEGTTSDSSSSADSDLSDIQEETVTPTTTPIASDDEEMDKQKKQSPADAAHHSSVRGRAAAIIRPVPRQSHDWTDLSQLPGVPPLLQSTKFHATCEPFITWLSQPPITQSEAMVKARRVRNPSQVLPIRNNLRFLLATLHEQRLDQVPDSVTSLLAAAGVPQLEAFTQLNVCQRLFDLLVQRQIGSARVHALFLLIKKVLYILTSTMFQQTNGFDYNYQRAI